MDKFFICSNGMAKGPYRLHEVNNLGIKANDLIWTSDFMRNRKAIYIKEFKQYFKEKASEEKLQKNLDENSSNTSILKKAILFSLLTALAVMVLYYLSVN